MGRIVKELDPGVTVDAGLQVMDRHQGAHKEVVCLRVTRKGLECGRCQLGVDFRKGIVVCLHARKVGIREGCVYHCQCGWVVRCGFSVKGRIEGVVF